MAITEGGGGGSNKELAKREAWISLLKQEARVDDYLEMCCGCVDHPMGVNQEAALLSLETDTQGNTDKEEKGRGRGQNTRETF